MNEMSAGNRSWRPSCTVSTAKRRASMLAAARDFFASRDILEVETPMLSANAVSDPNIESIRAMLRVDNGTSRYLHTSPEYYMKRLLCNGYPDIYSICRVFRDSECGKRHQPEFTMAEWYRHDFGIRDMIAETCEFIRELIDAELIGSATDTMSYSQAFADFAGIDVLRADCDALADTVDADPRLRAVIGKDRDQWLDLVMSRKIAPAFAADRLTVIHHYPASQGALARICPDDPSCADRFEVFFGDLELANGYVELLDAETQEKRWQHEQQIRRRRGQALAPWDQKFLDALQSGLPACAGVAVGFDRLLMINVKSGDIARVQTFAFERLDSR